MIPLLIVVIVLLVALLAGQLYIMHLMVRRSQHLEFELEDRDREIELRDRQAFADIRTMFRMKEDLDNAHISLEMVLNENQRLEKNFEKSLELALRG